MNYAYPQIPIEASKKEKNSNKPKIFYKSFMVRWYVPSSEEHLTKHDLD